MNRLQKNTWIELVSLTLCVAAAGVMLARLVRSNASGPIYLIVCLLVGLPVGLFGYLVHQSELKKLDERERQIARRAFVLSSFAFVMFIGCSACILFFTVGAAGSIPVYTMPAVFLGGVFIGKFTESAFILIQFAKEQGDG